MCCTHGYETTDLCIMRQEDTDNQKKYLFCIIMLTVRYKNNVPDEKIIELREIQCMPWQR